MTGPVTGPVTGPGRGPVPGPDGYAEPGYSGPPPTVPPAGWDAGRAWGSATWPGAARPRGPWPGAAPWPGTAPWPGGAGWPGAYGWPPRGPSRPGTVITAAVLSFVQGALVAVASLYVLVLGAVAEVTGSSAADVPVELRQIATEARVLAVVQVVSVVLLVTAGVLALVRRHASSLWLLVGAQGVQVLLAGYWALRLTALGHDVPGPDPLAALAGAALVFAAAPVTAAVLALTPGARRWLAGEHPVAGTPTA